MTKTAELYRMSTDQHICPFGLKSRGLLKRKGFKLNDHRLSTREETDRFKADHQVETTPQVFIEGERIGGYDALRDYLILGLGKETFQQDGRTYAPVISVFAMSLIMAIAVVFATKDISATPAIKYFIAISMSTLAIQKFRDLYAFSNQFITYDLLAMRLPGYAYVYPFLEAWAGVGMLAGISPLLYAPAAIFIGVVGAISVVKAVYIDKRELKCACVGGNSDVPLGLISLTENLFMLAGGIWMMSQSL